ncbi:hypothetical protein O4J56_10145 [Nocardiopsis sp. RSe5-2]|uniref:Tetratricopeptide repeat protein n=1 Tax=Nocardiopsis endophytica TaxID=3018445 RepID=A0ABT4U2T6_9ACTN|nr:hypothetical protein [Nocardiopsis endophytica]MDA2810996.1 hypothetical protein [Nocardiopsis endophytica]
MSDESVSTLLRRASRSLSECEFWVRHIVWEDGALGPLGEARRLCDEAERSSDPEDAETSGTLAVLRSTAAAYALRHCVGATVGCDFDDEDGTLPDGLSEHDPEGVSRPLAEEAVRAARAALDVDPGDALVPLHLGHALTWVGDQEGAVEAYREALRRDPGEVGALSCLKHFGAFPDDLDAHDRRSWDEARMYGQWPYTAPESHGSHGFFLLRVPYWMDNNNADHDFVLFASAAEACAHLDRVLNVVLGDGDFVNGGLDEEDDEVGGVVLRVHRPGRPVAEYDLTARVGRATDGVYHVDRSGLPLDEAVENPLPAGRPVRIDTRTCFASPE